MKMMTIRINLLAGGSEGVCSPRAGLAGRGTSEMKTETTITSKDVNIFPVNIYFCYIKNFLMTIRTNPLARCSAGANAPLTHTELAGCGSSES